MIPWDFNLAFILSQSWTPCTDQSRTSRWSGTLAVHGICRIFSQATMFIHAVPSFLQDTDDSEVPSLAYATYHMAVLAHVFLSKVQCSSNLRSDILLALVPVTTPFRSGRTTTHTTNTHYACTIKA